MTPSSPLALYGFLLARTLAGAARRRLRRLKEPRYLLGTAVAIAYFALMFGRPAAHRGGAPASLAGRELPPVVPVAAGFALTALALLAWVFRPARAALPLTEAEVQFLFPAPLTRRSVLRFSLLRGQLAILLGAGILALLYRGAAGFRSFLPAWLLLASVNLHAQGIAFTKAAWNELAPRRRVAAFAAGLLAALGLLALASAGLLSALDALPLPAALARAGEMVLLPARLLVRPLLHVGSAPPWTELLPAALLVLLHFLWVDRSTVRWEEATIADAARRAAQRLRLPGTAAAAKAARGRASVPFALAPTGAPETAILWKNLLAIRRTPFATQALLLLAFLGTFGVGAAAFVARSPARLLAVQTAVVVVAASTVVVALATPFVQREDLRSDLVLADVLRTWPVRPARLVAGELAAPLLAGTVRLGAGLLLALALSTGGAIGLRISGAFVGFPHDNALVLFARPASLLPWLGAAAVLVPPLLALLLVVQNAATVALPAWFPPGPRRPARGPEMTGMRIVSFVATVLLVGLALLPAALAAGVAAWLGRGLDTAWAPALAPLAAVPLVLEAAFGVLVLGKLLQRYDPALEAGG